MSNRRLPRCPSCGCKCNTILYSANKAIVGQQHCRGCGYVFDPASPGPHPTLDEVKAFKARPKETPHP